MANQSCSTNFVSTYQEGFVNKASFLPPHRNFQQESFYDDGEEKLQPRCFPISLPIFPHRKRDSDIPIALGFDTLTLIQRMYANENLPEKNSQKKTECTDTPIDERTTSHLPSDISPIVIEELVELGTFTPSSQINVPPCFQKWSIKKDSNGKKQIHLHYPVNFKATNKQKPEIWQKIGCAWDQLQERNVVEKIELSSTCEKKSNLANRLLNRPRIGEQKKTAKSQEIQPTQIFSCKVPGYGGYQPRLPVPCGKQHARTTSNRTYRRYPAFCYCLPKYGHNSLMSRMVMLTEPCNPLNKITVRRISIP